MLAARLGCGQAAKGGGVQEEGAEAGGGADTAPLLLRGAGAAPDHVQRRVQDGIATLSFAAPGGNRFSLALVDAIARAFHGVSSDRGVRAVVFTARGPDFCAGPHADLPPPGPDPTPMPEVLERLHLLCQRIAESPLPVVCALHGRVSSGGLALALAAQVRLADPRAVFHLPEPRLGLLPPGGAAVRLGWRIGAGAALAFLRAERPLSARQVLDLGMIDAIEPEGGGGQEGGAEGLLPAAQRVAAALARHPLPDLADNAEAPGLADPAGFRGAIAQARAALPAPLPGHRRHEAQLIDTVEAVQLLPPEAALAFDLVQAQEAATAPPARALAYLARAMRRVHDTPEARQAVQPGGRAPRRRSDPLALALEPADAALLVPPLLRAGRRIVMLAPDADALTAVLEAVAEIQLDAIAAGSLSQSDADADWARLEGRLALDADADALPALGLASASLAGWLDAALPAGCPRIVWNPGSAALPAPSGGSEQVQLVPGQMRNRGGLPLLAEIVVPAGLAPEATLQADDLARSMQATPLRAGGAPVLPAMLEAAGHAARVLVQRGVTAASLAASRAALGLLPGSVPDGIAAPRAKEDAVTLPLPPERLLVLALINAGARLLEAGQALRPSDIDVAMVLGAGYPDWRGGPMAEGDGLGLLVLRHELRQAAALAPPEAARLWTPAPLIDELIRLSWRFEDINRD
ncbi:MAG: enoyl-CoA hydratase-related protein [Pararhodobacter sp.]